MKMVHALVCMYMPNTTQSAAVYNNGREQGGVAQEPEKSWGPHVRVRVASDIGNTKQRRTVRLVLEAC
jgi:predicted membrane-bound mannosyltransferase